ncbi:MAG: NAD-dependent epimerase/dehydratase family protein [Candidatus Woesearchaeota archaeon]
MKTFLITGGEGFIGYHLIQELLKDENNQIISYDALKHFVPLSKSHWCFYQDYRVKTLNSDRLIRVRGNILSKGFLRDTMEKYKPNVIIHLAALPIANVSNTYPEEATDDIFMTTMNILDVVKSLSYKIDRLVHISSSMVYGDFLRDKEGKVIPAQEGQMCHPKCIYGCMKLNGEILVRTYNKRFGIPYTIVRPSAVYGPTDCNRRVTEIFVMNLLQGKELVLDNGGLHQLDFTYVKDLVQGLMLATTSDKALGETFNITCGNGRKIKDFAEILLKLYPESGSKAVVKAVDVYRPNRGTLDISKAKNLLGYKPQYNLEKGMKEYVDFVKETWLKNQAKS